MPINLQVTLGTVNFTDWLHVTAAKVADPSTIVWETWIDVPVTNYVFVIPGLDPDDYYVSFYDAPTDVALGSLVSQAFVNAKSPEFAYEIRFYTFNNLPAGATLDASEKILHDPYLIGKDVISFFKEGFRPLEPAIDVTFSPSTGDIALINGSNFQAGSAEKFVITIKYAVGNGSTSPGALYTGTITITDPTKTLSTLDKNKRVRLLGSLATQVITVPPLAGLAIEDGYYFDNTVGGVAVQVKLLFPGTDRLLYNGFMVASNLFAEFWVSSGEHLLIRKFTSAHWEVITDYMGTRVGERIAAGYRAHPNTLPEDGAEVDGNEYGRLWWWINNVLPATHYISDDTGTQVPARRGQFIVKPGTKKILMPNSQNISERGLVDFNAYGGDPANRPYDYPGGFQDEMLLRHNHAVKTTNSSASESDVADPVRGSLGGSVNTKGQEGTNKSIEEAGGDEQRVKNIGVIYVRRI